MSSTLLSLSKKGIRSRSSVSDMSSNQDATGTWRFEEARCGGIRRPFNITYCLILYNYHANIVLKKQECPLK